MAKVGIGCTFGYWLVSSRFGTVDSDAELVGAVLEMANKLGRVGVGVLQHAVREHIKASAVAEIV